MSVISKIKEHASVRPEEWINGGEYERLGMQVWVSKDGKHYKASNVARRLRELENAKILERQENIKGNVEYKYIRITDRTVIDIKPPTKPSSPQPLFQLAPKINSRIWI